MQMTEIKSKDNEKIKFLRKLGQKKYRDKEGRFFVENFKIIYDGLMNGYDFESLFATNEFIEKNKKSFKQILDKSSAENYYLIDDRINKSFSDLDNPPGICAVYKKEKKYININEEVVYLNSINDPGNVGTILRSALAFGLKNIVLDEGCADLYNYKTIQAAKDSIFKLNIEIDKNLKIFNKIKDEMEIISTSLEKGGDISILNEKNKFCLVFGSESHGVNEEILNKSDNFIKIKISDNIESLNVASSAAIIFHYIFNNT